MSNVSEINVVVVGAGVVGLAIALELSHQHKDIYVFERNSTFGLEGSSRNSQVIHAGIYYPPDSLKARLCVEGKYLLYELCQRYGIGHKRSGKLIVAVEDKEVEEVERIYEQGRRSGVGDLKILSQAEIRSLEPNIQGIVGLLSPSTGVVDCHHLMRFLYQQSVDGGIKFVFNTEVIGIEKTGDKCRVEVKDEDGVSAFSTRLVINCAGLHADRVAQSAGVDVDKAGYRLHYCKGEYFTVDPKVGKLAARLIYPIPELAGVGIHLTSDVEGNVRLGPDTEYVDKIDCAVDETKRELFCRSARRYLPAIEIDDLTPDFAGVRPKLQAPGEEFRDFVIASEEDKGLPGLINLIGMESPGLTASLAVAKYVAAMVSEIG